MGVCDVPVVSTVCRSGRIARLQVLERTVPDSGTGLEQWWAEHGTDDSSWIVRTCAELIERAGPAAERHITTVSLSLGMKADLLGRARDARRRRRAADRSIRCEGRSSLMSPRADKKLYSTVLAGRAGQHRRDRRAARQAAAHVYAADAAQRRAAARVEADAERAERAATTYLPRSGEPGPAGLRTWQRFTLSAHQDTSATLSGAYPFLAEGGLGSNGVLVGAGESSLVKSLYTRSIPFGRKVYVVGDPKGEHTPVAQAVGAKRSCSATARPTGSTRSMKVTGPRASPMRNGSPRSPPAVAT